MCSPGGCPNTLDAGFCVEAWEEALKKGRPDIFNTDQGAQFTSEAFTGLLQQHGIRISMDGKGSYNDNLFIGEAVAVSEIRRSISESISGWHRRQNRSR